MTILRDDISENGAFGRQALRIGIALALSVLGMALHTVREFGYVGLLEAGTGFPPVTSVQLTLFVVWWSLAPARAHMATALAVTGIFQLIGGAIISVLPLQWLPFLPEQSLEHYITHVVLGISQMPLILVGWRLARSHRQARAARGSTSP